MECLLKEQPYILVQFKLFAQTSDKINCSKKDIQGNQSIKEKKQ